MSQRRQLKDGISHRQQSRIGVGFGSQPHIAVPHDFHRHARGGACAGKIGGQRVTQGMEVGPVSLGVYKFNACRRQVGLESLHGRHNTGKDSRFACGQFSDVRTHLGYKIRMQGNNGLLMILGRGCTDIDKWLLAFQMEVISLQRGHFTTSKAGVDGGEIDHLPIPANKEKALHFVIGEGTSRPDLPTVGLHLLNMHERITGNALMFFHPVEKGRNRAKIFVEGFGRKGLLRPPGLEGIGGNVAQDRPAAIPNQSPHSVLEFINILAIAVERRQIGHVLFQMLLQRRLRGVAQRFRREHPCGFKLSVSDDLLQFLLRHPLVAGVKRYIIDFGFPFEAITSAIKPGNLGLAVLGSLGAENGANHKVFLFSGVLLPLLFEFFEVGGHVGMVEPG